MGRHTESQRDTQGRPVAKEFRRGSKINGFTSFSATSLLELVKLMISMAATAQWDQATWVGQEGHENSSEIVMMMHAAISRTYFHAPCKEEKYVEPDMERKMSRVWTAQSVAVRHS